MTNTVQKKTLDDREVVEGFLARAKPKLEEALKGSTLLPFSHFLAHTQLAMMQPPRKQNDQTLIDVARANPASLFQELFKAATLRLSPNPALGHFYLIPFAGRLQAVVGYRGWLWLAMQSGKVESVDAWCIYREDAKRLGNGDLIDPATGRITIRKATGNHLLAEESERVDEDIVAAVCEAYIKDVARPATHVLRVDQIVKRARVNKQQKGDKLTGVPSEWWPEYCCKTVLRALLTSGRVPMARDEVAQAISKANELEEVEPAEFEVVETEAETFARLDKDPLPAKVVEREPGEEG